MIMDMFSYDSNFQLRVARVRQLAANLLFGFVITGIMTCSFILGSSADGATLPSMYNQAPELMQQVEKGLLPPIDDRLPLNPMIVQPVDHVGVHGNAWRMGMLRKRDQGLFIRYLSYENLLRWDSRWTKVIPNVAQSHLADATTYPKHFLKQFLPKYNPSIEKLVRENKVSTWVELFHARFGTPLSIDDPSRWQTPKLPALNAWIQKTPYAPELMMKHKI